MSAPYFLPDYVPDNLIFLTMVSNWGQEAALISLDRIINTINDGEKMWVRLRLLAMIISTAVIKVGRRGGLMGLAGEVTQPPVLPSHGRTRRASSPVVSE